MVICSAAPMGLTRREFIVTATAAAAVTAIPASALSCDFPREPTAWIQGDPYRACAEPGGIGGRNFHECRDLAMRLRTPADIRDMYTLGLELPHA